ncbi:MAG TPA: type VI secretion system baseplate subunit TssE [Xanthomonadales bacterium]|nr:type VI secretion system baseplate subunit TssE [Xanthomonadales bacterium]
MAKRSAPDQLQPALLDRLTDHNPDNKKESGARRTLSQKQYKDAVIRDLGALFNSVSLDSVVDLDAYPEVRRSVLNYGLPDFSGRPSSGIEVAELEKNIKRVICDFEPRIIRNSLRVRVRSDPSAMNSNALYFEIEGVVFEQPMPFQVLLHSKLDLESGDFDVSEDRG